MSSLGILFSLLFVLIALPLQVVRAQDPELELRKIQFWTLAWDGEVRGLSYADNNDDAVPVKANYRYVEGSYDYSGVPSLTLFTQSTQPDGTTVRIPAALFTIPPVGDKFLLLLAKVSNGPGRMYRVIGLNYDDSNFEYGSYRFLNTTSKRMGIMLGESKLLLAPKEDKSLHPEIGNKERFFARIAAVEDESNWQLIFSSEWTHQSNKRFLIIFYEDDSGKIKVKPVTV